MKTPILFLSDAVSSSSGLGRITRDLATPEASLAIHAQADRDRATYFLKWGERL